MTQEMSGKTFWLIVSFPKIGLSIAEILLYLFSSLREIWCKKPVDNVVEHLWNVLEIETGMAIFRGVKEIV